MKFVCEVCDPRCVLERGFTPSACVGTGQKEPMWMEFFDGIINVCSCGAIKHNDDVIGKLNIDPRPLCNEDDEIIMMFRVDKCNTRILEGSDIIYQKPGPDYKHVLPTHLHTFNTGDNTCIICSEVRGAKATTEDSKIITTFSCVPELREEFPYWCPIRLHSKGFPVLAYEANPNALFIRGHPLYREHPVGGTADITKNLPHCKKCLEFRGLSTEYHTLWHRRRPVFFDDDLITGEISRVFWPCEIGFIQKALKRKSDNSGASDQKEG